MIQVLLLTRGGLAAEWLRAATDVCGRPPAGMEALGLDPEGACEEDTAHVRMQVLRQRKSGFLLILTDLHGSTPTNLAAALARDDGVSVVAGANLPMVLRLACDERTDRSLAEITDWICAKGRAAIHPVEAPPTPTESGS